MALDHFLQGSFDSLAYPQARDFEALLLDFFRGKHRAQAAEFRGL